MDEGRFIQGIKQVTLSDVYLRPSACHEGQWILMPAIIGETLGQLGAWCAMHANGFKWRPVAGVAATVHILGEAYIGDTIFLETTIDSLDDSAVEYHSRALVNKKPIFTIDGALGPMLPMEDFIDPAEVKRQFEKIYRLGDMPEQLETENTHTHLVASQPLKREYVGFDKILEWELRDRAVLQKSLSLSAAYLPEHFPRKPVLPLTILLEAKLELAAKFLKESYEDGKSFVPIIVRRIKMSGFVQPGDTVITRMRLKEKTDNQAVLVFHSELAGGRRVCMTEAVFEKKTYE